MGDLLRAALEGEALALARSTTVCEVLEGTDDTGAITAALLCALASGDMTVRTKQRARHNRHLIDLIPPHSLAAAAEFLRHEFHT